MYEQNSKNNSLPIFLNFTWIFSNFFSKNCVHILTFSRNSGEKEFTKFMKTSTTNGMIQNFPLDVIRTIKQYCIEAADSVKGMKVLLLDKETTSIISLVIGQLEILQKEVYLFEEISSNKREEMFHLQAVCFLRATEENMKYLEQELARPKYGGYYLFFTNTVSDNYLRSLASYDELEVVKEVSEFYADYYSINQDVWTLNLSNEIIYSSLTKPGTISDSRYSSVMCRMTDGITALLLSLKIRPFIRYQASSARATQLAQSLETIIKNSSNFHLGQSKTITPVLLILDRNEDPMTPLLTTWTYQALCHQLIGLHNNRLDMSSTKDYNEKNPKYLVLSSLQDEFFSNNMYCDYGDLGSNIQKLVSDFSKESISKNPNVESIEEIKRIVDGLSDYQKASSNISKHLSIITELQNQISNKKLLSVSPVEQELVCVNDHTSATTKINQLFSDMIFNNENDAIRVVLLYSIRYNSHPNNQLSEFIERIRSIFGTSSEKLSVFNNIGIFSNPKNRSQQLDLLSNKSFFGSISAKARRELTGVPNIYKEHTPILKNILNLLRESKLDLNQYPILLESKNTNTIANANTNTSYNQNISSYSFSIAQKNSISMPSPPQDILIFIVGGATFEEAAYIHSLNAQANNFHYVLGSTSILRPDDFIDSLRHVKNNKI